MPKMNPMVSLEMTDEEKLDQFMPAGLPARLDYPPGLHICLTEREMDKLDVDPAEAVVGGLVHLHAMARITSVSQEDRDGKKACRVEMQIEDMCCVESEDEENSEAESSMNPLHDRSKGRM